MSVPTLAIRTMFRDVDTGAITDRGMVKHHGAGYNDVRELRRELRGRNPSRLVENINNGVRITDDGAYDGLVIVQEVTQE